MSRPVTFKIVGPAGSCKRATFQSTPGVSALEEVAARLLQGGRLADHQLFYVDSDGDRVLITTSDDVVEAVRDAASRARTVRAYVTARPVKSADAAASLKATAHCKTQHGPSGGCGQRRSVHQWQALGARARPRSCFSDGQELEDVMDVFSAVLFPGLFTLAGRTRHSYVPHHRPEDPSSKADAFPGSSTARKQEDGEQRVTEPPSTSPAASTDTAADASSPAVAEAKESLTAPPSPPAQSEADTFVQVESPPTHSTGGAALEDEDAAVSAAAPVLSAQQLDEKAQMLQEMGFDLPADVARSLVKELGGRMDLIVRALVANGK